MIYWLFYILMLIGFTGVGLATPSLKGKFIGIILAIANGLIFWKTK